MPAQRTNLSDHRHTRSRSHTPAVGVDRERSSTTGMHDLGTSSLAELFEIGSVGSDLTVAASAESPTIENNNTNDTTVSGSATIFNSNPNLNILSSTAVTVNYSQNNILNAPAPEPLNVIQKMIAAALIKHHVPNATYDAQHGEGCMEGTRLQILRDIEMWILSPKAQQIFWLAGMAGTGKTAIAQTVCCQIVAHAGIMLGGSFFCSRSTGSITQRDVRCVVPTLAQLLARQSIDFSKSLATELARDPDILHKTVSVQVKRLLYNPLWALKDSGIPIVFVIDALDECGGQSSADKAVNDAQSHLIVSEMLEALVKFSRSTPQLPVKFLVTSRPETHIRDTPVSDVTFSTVLHLHTVNKAQVNADIRLYVSTQLSSSHRLRAKFTYSHADMLAQVCDGLFIVATTALKYTLGAGLDSAPSRFKRLINATGDGLNSQAAAPLDRMYGLILEDAVNLNETDVDGLQAMLQLLASILCARMALSVLTLANLIGVETDEIRARLAHLHSVVYVPEDDGDSSLRTLHASFGDYLLGRAPDSIRILSSLGHDVLARGCLCIMARSLHFNVSQSQSSYEPNRVARIDIIAKYLEYGCFQWVYHVAAATVPSEFDSEIYAIFRLRFLFWLEVVSVLSQIERAIAMLFFGASTVRQPELSKFLRDAHGFVTSSSEVIKRSAPHIYLSALSFTPKDSSVFQTFYPLCTGLISVETRAVNLHRGRFVMTLIGHERVVRSVAYSPDGCFIASGSDDGTVRIWDARSGEEAMPPLRSGDGILWSVAFSPKGKVVAAGTEAGTVCIWSLLTDKTTLLPLSGHLGTVRSVTFSPDGMYLVSASLSKTVNLWHAETGRLLATLDDHTGMVGAVAFSPDGAILATAADDHTVRLWDIATRGQASRLLPTVAGLFYSICFSPDGTKLASAGLGGDITLWDLPSRTLDATFRDNVGWVDCIKFSPDGKLLASNSNDRVCVWSVSPNTGEMPSIILEGHKDQVHAACFSADGLYIATASADRTIRIWNATNGQNPVQSQPAHELGRHSMAASPDGTFVVSSLADHSISVWDIQTRVNRFPPLKGHTAPVHSVTCSSDGQLIASASADYTVRIWDAQTGDAVGDPIVGHTDRVRAVAFSSNTRWIASGSSDRLVYVWEVSSGQRSNIGPLKCDGSVYTVAFSPDGQLVAGGDDTGRIYVWKSGSRDYACGPLKFRDTAIHSISLSPNSTRLLSGGDRGILLVWNIATGQLRRIIGESMEPANQILTVAYSPDGRFICSGSEDGSVCLRTEATGGLIPTLRGHVGKVNFATFVRDGRSMVSADDETIRVWDVDTTQAASIGSESDPAAKLAAASRSGEWLVGPCGELLMWVPSEYHEYLQILPCTLLIGRSCVAVTIGDEGWKHGPTWTSCWR